MKLLVCGLVTVSVVESSARARVVCQASRRGRPVSLLWTKSDVLDALGGALRPRAKVFQERAERLREALLPGSTTGAVSIENDAGRRAILQASADLLDRVLAFRAPGFELPAVSDTDPFLAYRGSP